MASVRHPCMCSRQLIHGSPTTHHALTCPSSTGSFPCAINSTPEALRQSGGRAFPVCPPHGPSQLQFSILLIFTIALTSSKPSHMSSSPAVLVYPLSAVLSSEVILVVHQVIW
jgi:hypothetical protein